MQAKDCVLNRRVALTGSKYPLQKGTIAGPVSQHPTAGEVVVVEWDNGQIQKVTLRSLLDDDESTIKEMELENEQLRLEEEWNETEKKIKDKISKASKLILDASKLAEESGKTLADMYSIQHELERAMDSAGWNTSSWHC